MAISIQAILPTRRLSEQSIRNEAQRWLRDFAVQTQYTMQLYPPQQPTTYVRTGAYGRSWRTRYSTDRVDIYNNVAYAVWVGGSTRRYPGQSRVMASKGWVSIAAVADEARRAELPKWSRVIWK